MPRKASQRSLAEQNSAPGGAAAVDRAMSLVKSFRAGDKTLSLAELSTRTLLYKSTLLRLIASLEHNGLVRRFADGRYGLGAEVARLNAIYVQSFSLEDLVMPILKSLVERTRESAAYHVRQDDKRLCLFRVDSPQTVRDNIRVGDFLPLDRGAGGRVLTAFGGAKGAPYAKIRREGVAVVVGDRIADLAGISAPVFDATASAVGALTLTMPVSRLNRKHALVVVQSAAQLTSALGGRAPS